MISKAYERRVSKEGVPRPRKRCPPWTQGRFCRATPCSPPRGALGLALRGTRGLGFQARLRGTLDLGTGQPATSTSRLAPEASRSPKTPRRCSCPQLSGSTARRSGLRAGSFPRPAPAGLTSRAQLRPDLGTRSVGPRPAYRAHRRCACSGSGSERLPAARCAPPPPPRPQGSLPGP